MKIQYLGHSSFRLISQLGTAVICDPYNGDMVGFSMPRLSCDVVTISHHHADHDYVDGVRGMPPVLEKEIYLAADDVAVQSFQSYHDVQKGKQRGENYVFCFLMDGLKVVHMGDIGELDEALAYKLRNCDVLLVPVGGFFTIDGQGAKWYVDKIKPKIVIPMHYKTAEHNFDIDTVEQFTCLFDADQVHYLASETLHVEDLPEYDKPQIFVLERYRD